LAVKLTRVTLHSLSRLERDEEKFVKNLLLVPVVMHVGVPLVHQFVRNLASYKKRC
jgi:hypothetical protein